jgi:limonene-1,2-epoxide hydrolase
VSRDPARAVATLVQAVQQRDLDAICACFTAEASYGNVGYTPAQGREQIRAMFAPIISRSTRIEWEIRSQAVSDDEVFAERIDRFWIDGKCFEIECLGIYQVDGASGLIAEVRDYVDLGIWRARLGSVLDEPATRP